MQVCNTTIKILNKICWKLPSRAIEKLLFPILYILLIVALSGCSYKYSQQVINLEIEGTEQKSIVIITPPYSTFPISKGAYKTNSKHRFQALLIENVSMNYYEMLTYASEGKLLSYKSQKNSPPHLKQSKILETKNITSGRIVLFEHNQTKKILIETDYDNLLKCTDVKCITSNFETLSHEVLKTLAKYEKLSSSGDEKLTLPHGAALEILVKLFETIPHPESASLSRYGKVQGKYHMVLFLHPSMRLIVDTTNKLKRPNEIYILENTSFHSFSRNKRGEISQLPYFENTSLDKQTTFSKTQQGSGNEIVILATTADMHYSSATRSSNYIALLQMPMKNSIHSNGEHLDDDDAKDYCKTYECQSAILYGLPDKVISPNDLHVGVIPEYKNKAVFGDRSYISVEFPIYINDTKIYVQAGSTIATLLQLGDIPRNFNLFRKYKGIYHPFKTDKNIDIQLLPGDRFKI